MRGMLDHLDYIHRTYSTISAHAHIACAGCEELYIVQSNDVVTSYEIISDTRVIHVTF